jgi:hypothetical protein
MRHPSPANSRNQKFLASFFGTAQAGALTNKKRINHEGTKARSYLEGEIFVKSFVPLCLRGKIFYLDATYLGSYSFFQKRRACPCRACRQQPGWGAKAYAAVT